MVTPRLLSPPAPFSPPSAPPSPGLEKSGHPGEQASFHSHLPDDKGLEQVVSQLNLNRSKLRIAQGKLNLRAAFLKGNL